MKIGTQIEGNVSIEFKDTEIDVTVLYDGWMDEDGAGKKVYSYEITSIDFNNAEVIDNPIIFKEVKYKLERYMFTN